MKTITKRLLPLVSFIYLLTEHFGFDKDVVPTDWGSIFNPLYDFSTNLKFTWTVLKVSDTVYSQKSTRLSDSKNKYMVTHQRHNSQLPLTPTVIMLSSNMRANCKRSYAFTVLVSSTELPTLSSMLQVFRWVHWCSAWACLVCIYYEWYQQAELYV